VSGPEAPNRFDEEALDRSRVCGAKPVLEM
jgi:hypothetical protein